MKRVLALVLALVLMGVFAACGTPASSTPPSTAPSVAASAAPSEPTPEPREPQTVVFWHSMEAEAGAAFEKIVKDFNAGPGAEMQITVESIFQGSYPDASTKLRTILQSNQVDQLPDVMQLDATGIADYMATEHAFTVDDAVALDTGFDLASITEAPLKAWNYAGVQYGLPVSASTTVMYYNKTMLDAAGITTAPTTFAEIIAAAEKLPENNSNGQALTAYAQVPNTPSMANWIGQIPGNGANASYVVNNRNGRDASATELVADKEGTLLTFLTAWKEMYDAGALLNSGDALSELFLTEQIAFYTSSTSQTVSLLTQIDGRFELGCANFPRIDDKSNFGATVSGSAVFMFSKGDEARALAAWEFVKYITGAQAQAEFSVATGYTPVNAGSVDIQEFKDYVAQYPQMLIGAEQMAQTSPDMMGVTVGPSRDFYLAIQEAVSNMLINGDSAEATAESMSATLNDLLEQYAKSQGE